MRAAISPCILLLTAGCFFGDRALGGLTRSLQRTAVRAFCLYLPLSGPPPLSFCVRRLSIPMNNSRALAWMNRHKASSICLPLLAIVGAGAHFLARFRMERSG